MTRLSAAALLAGAALTALPVAPASAAICTATDCPALRYVCSIVDCSGPAIQRQCFDTGDVRFCIP